jgi:hypothetical protein
VEVQVEDIVKLILHAAQLNMVAETECPVCFQKAWFTSMFLWQAGVGQAVSEGLGPSRTVSDFQTSNLEAQLTLLGHDRL